MIPPVSCPTSDTNDLLKWCVNTRLRYGRHNLDSATADVAAHVGVSPRTVLYRYRDYTTGGVRKNADEIEWRCLDYLARIHAEELQKIEAEARLVERRRTGIRPAKA
jgi:hypothetical protein